MAVRRIVANIAATELSAAQLFYGDVLGLALKMDHGWIATWGTDAAMAIQVSVATEGGSGTPVPGLSIEVDDLAAVEMRLAERGIPLVYGPADEPWGVRRLFVRDPFGTLVNILEHRPAPGS